MSDEFDRQYWDSVAEAMQGRYHLDPVMAEHKRRVHLDLLREWLPGERLAGARILKTDVFEEAHGPDQVLLDWPGNAKARVFAMDLSPRMCALARDLLRGGDLAVPMTAADNRALPFRDGAFDVVYSCSTLDHFESIGELMAGLRETARVVAPGGALLLTLDNPETRFYPLVRALERRGLVQFKLGETLPGDEIAKRAHELGLSLEKLRPIYHVPRVLVTAALRAARVVPGDALPQRIERWLSGAEAKGRARRNRKTAWYTAALLRKGMT